MAEMKLSWLMERNLKDMEGASTEDISSKVAELINKESFEKPSNTVPEDPRISEINKEIERNGISPGLLRGVSNRVHTNLPRPRLERLKTTSCVIRGVSDASLLRALKTATGGLMPPKLMREVSQTVLVEENVVDDAVATPNASEHSVITSEWDEDASDDLSDIEIPKLKRQTAW